MATPSAVTSRLDQTGNRVSITGDGYRVVIRDTGTAFAYSPYALLIGADGRRWSAINLLSSVHRIGMPDETRQLEALEVSADGDDVVVTVHSHSSAWRRHSLVLRCTPTAIELTVSVEGRGRIADVTVFGGNASLADGTCGTFRSSIDFRSVFVPTPTEPVQFVRPARSAAALGVVGDSAPGRLNGVFSPPPLALGLGREPAGGATELPGGAWLGLSLRAPVADLGFSTMRYEPLDAGFLVRLEYDGHTAVDGAWTSPVFVLRPAASGWDVLRDYRADLAGKGFAPAIAAAPQEWWYRPIFCGWGAQCARVAHPLVDLDDDDGSDPATVPSPLNPASDVRDSWLAAEFARQDVYDELLDRLRSNGVHPGTIVIDDRWQKEYGTATPDPERWPDLRGWIADRHADGQRVLLWWKAWDPGGLPLEECVLDASGRAVSADPANPAYRRRLARIADALLSERGMDADGFKVDFTQRAPSGKTLIATEGAWGVAGLHLLMSTLYQAAKAAKPDALVIAHAVHPSFADTCDLVRLNDVLKRDIASAPVAAVDQMILRHQIVSAVLPEHGIDTDQWPIQNRAEWLDYVAAAPTRGVPSLYYVESIDRSHEPISPEDLRRVATAWAAYRPQPR